MGLQFYLGGSGSGKSYELYHRMIQESIENPQRNFLIVVPDQFTMQTQKELCLMHPRGGIMNLDVLSFGRLAHRVFEETGGLHIPILDDTGKNLVLRKVAQEKAEELSVMKTHLKKIGYIHEVKSAISEFMQYGIRVEDLDGLIQFASVRGSLSHKLADLKVLYEGFLQYNKDKFLTTEELLTHLTRRLSQSAFVKDSVVVFDGFTGFTPVQANVIQELFGITKQVWITVSIDGKVDPYQLGEPQSLFYLSQQTIQKMEKINQDVGSVRERSKDVRLMQTPVWRYRKNPELAFLEEYIFRYPLKSYTDEVETLRIYTADNPEEEVRTICREIDRLIREKGYRYQDFAIVTGDLEGYSHMIEKELPQFGIPYFLDMTKGILTNPFIEYVKSALEVVQKGYPYEAMMRFLRSGMTPLSQDEIDQMENYMLACGMRGKKRWQNLWIRKPGSYRQESEECFEHLNQSRERIADLLQKIPAGTHTAVAFTEALYDFIVESEIAKQLTLLQHQFELEGELAKAKEYGQIYTKVMQLLEQIVDLLGEESLTLEEYIQILAAGFEEIKIGIIPQSVDQVVVGDMERTRLKSIRVLFFAGVNDGIIPKNGGSGGILSDLEREFLQSSEFEMAPTPRQKMYVQRLYLYLNMTKPSDYLYVSYAKVNMQGKSLRPAYLVETLCRMYPALQIQEKRKEGFLENLSVAKEGIHFLMSHMRAYMQNTSGIQEEFFTLYHWYQKNPLYEKEIHRMLEGAFFCYEGNRLSREAARGIYGEILENSVSRLEQYAACAYAQFLKYGLKLQEREEFRFQRVDMGSLFHSVLEEFSERLSQEGENWMQFSKETGERILTQVLEGCAAEYGDSVLYSSARTQYLVERMRRILLRTVDTLQYQLKKGIFKPEQFEVSFSMQKDMEHGEIMRLRGRIDRIDTYEKEDSVYVKVVDYKSGKRTFDPSAFYYGLQMQLLVYLHAAMEQEKRKYPDKKVIPAAVLYYHMEDPCIQTEGKPMSEEEIASKIKESLRMKGIVNEEGDIAEMLDSSRQTKSDVIPVEYKKDGSFSSRSSVMPEGEIASLLSYVDRKMKEIGKGILAGEKGILPYEMGTDSSCAFCGYRSVCCFDAKIPGYTCRRLEKLTQEEVMERIQKEQEEEKGD